jgi:hypothetical protein
MWQMSHEGQIDSDSGRYTVVHNPHNPITEKEGAGYGVMPVMGVDEELPRRDLLAHRGTDKAKFFLGEDS